MAALPGCMLEHGVCDTIGWSACFCHHAAPGTSAPPEDAEEEVVTSALCIGGSSVLATSALMLLHEASREDWLSYFLYFGFGV